MKNIKCWQYGKWAWKYDECKFCGNNKKDWNNRHKGNGLCIKCYDRKRGKNPKRKEYRKVISRNWLKRFQANPENFKIQSEYNSKWRATSKRYKYWLKNIEMKRRKFKYFLTKQKKFDKRHSGIEIVIDGIRIKTPIKVSLKDSELNRERVMLEAELFRNVYRSLNK